MHLDTSSTADGAVMCCGVDVELMHATVYRCCCSDLACTAELIIQVDRWALLCRAHESGFQLEELSDLLSEGRLTLPCPDNFLSSLLFFSTQ